MAAIYASSMCKCNSLSRVYVQISASASQQANLNCRGPTLIAPWKGKRLKRIPALKKHTRNALPQVSAKHYLVEKVTRHELRKILDEERESSYVVDFYATWCGPCIQLAQDLEMLAVEFGDTIKFIKIDTDEEWELARTLQIRGLPTVLFVSKDAGKNISRVEGVTPMELMRNIIQNEL